MGILQDPGLQARYGSGGASVGLAQGKIVIDTQSLAQQRGVVVREARLMGQSLQREIGGQTDAGVRQAETALNRLQSSLQSVTRGISLALGAIAGLGVASAQSVKSLEARFRLLAGSEEQATKQLATLREMADKTGQPFLQLVEGATAIMPALRGTNGELDKTLGLVQRLAILDPAQGVAGAAFSIREFINGEYLSLVRRLELDRKRVRAILAEADGDTRKQIDLLSDYIDEMGLTEEAMYEMGASGVNAFRVLRDEGTQTLAVFFEPFLNDFLIPITRAFRDMLRELRTLSPELQKFVGISAGLAATSALAQRGLPLIGAIPGGRAIAAGGVLAAAGYAGIQGGAFIARKAGLPGTEGKSQSEVINDAFTTFKQLLLVVTNAIGQFGLWIEEGAFKVGNAIGALSAGVQGGAALVGNALADLVDAIGSGVGTILEGFARFLEALEFDETLDLGLKKINISLGFGDLPDDLRDMADDAGHLGDALRTGDEEIQKLWDRWQRGTDLTEDQIATLQDHEANMKKNLLSMGEWLGVIEHQRSAVDVLSDAVGNLTNVFQMAADQARQLAAAEDIVITDDILDAFEQFQGDMAELEDQYQNDREQELEDHEKRKADLIDSYSDRVEEILENDRIRYERALRKTHDRETEIRAGMVEDIAESDAELAETLTELNEDYREGEEDALEDHLKAMQDIREAGQDALVKAAAKLDAQGIIDAKRSMERRLDDEKDSYKDEREERREKLDEAIADAMEAHDEQIRVAKESADEQIALLWDRFYQEEALRQEDTARQLAKLQTDHQQRMAELETEHQQRMADLRQRFVEETGQLKSHWANTFLATQTHLNAVARIESEHRKKVEDELRAWWERNQRYYIPAEPTGTTASSIGYLTADQGAIVPTMQGGGRVLRTGLHWLHQGEEVLRRQTANMMRRIAGGEIPPSGLVSAGAGGGRTVSLTMGDMNLNFPPGTDTGNTDAMAAVFRQELEAFLAELT